MGMAKAAELNHYPGPAHVIELKDRLRLSPEQRAAVKRMLARMNAAAKPLGVELIAREQALRCRLSGPHRRAGGGHRRTAEIGALQGRLRAVHLTPISGTRALLNAEQVKLYENLRGYGASGAAHQHHHPER